MSKVPQSNRQSNRQTTHLFRSGIGRIRIRIRRILRNHLDQKGLQRVVQPPLKKKFKGLELQVAVVPGKNCVLIF
jgi:hypothetical protein